MSHAQFLLRMESVKEEALEAFNKGECENPYSDGEIEHWVWELVIIKQRGKQ